MRYPTGSLQERRLRPQARPFESRFSRVMLAGGLLVVAYGVVGLLMNAHRTQPDQWVRWFVGSLVAHDLVLAPLVFGSGAVVVRSVPARWRAAVQAALIASGVVVVASWPFLRGYGRRADNPSVLPNDYAAGLAAVLAIVWVATLIGISLRRRRSPSRPVR